VLRSNSLPGPARVAGDAHRTVVGPHPDDALLEPGFLHRVDGAVVLLSGNVPGDRSAGDDLPLRLIRGEVGGDALPALPLVAGAVEVLGGVVDRVRIERGDAHRHRALEAVPHLLRIPAVEITRADGVVLLLSGAQVEPGEPALAVGVDDVGIAGPGHRGAGLAAAHLLPPRHRRDRRPPG